MAAFFFAALALTALIIAAAAAVAGVAARRDPDGSIAAAVADLSPVYLPLAAVIATVAMGGSLYFSEVLGYPPCTMCWYQRIAMYPLAPILGIAALRGDLGVRTYAWVLAISGAVISTYHYVIQWVPDLSATSCAVDNPCTAVFVREFGFVSIPFMALAGFLAISALLYAASAATGVDIPAAREADDVDDRIIDRH